MTSVMALIGTNRVTSRRWLAPAVSRVAKYKKAKGFDSKADLTIEHIMLPLDINNGSNRSVNTNMGSGRIVEAVTSPVAVTMGGKESHLKRRPKLLTTT